MNRILSITLNILVWGAILAYLVFASRYCGRQLQNVEVAAVDITVVDAGSLGAVTPQVVSDWMAGNGFTPEGELLESIDAERLRQCLISHPFICRAKVWTDLAGTLYIEVSQRRPVLRVFTEDGYDFYVSDDNWILPASAGNPEYLQVVSGRFSLPFAQGWSGSIAETLDPSEKKSVKNYNFLVKLINFVRLIQDDPFWNAQIVQIDVRETLDSDWKEPEVDLIPRVGSHVVVFGSLENAREKLEKLSLFYLNVLDHEGWDKYKYINVRYKDQVVCTNNY